MSQDKNSQETSRPKAQDEDRPAPANEGQASDQRAGEEAVQVNDTYDGGGPAPKQPPPNQDEQHPTGG